MPETEKEIIIRMEEELKRYSQDFQHYAKKMDTTEQNVKTILSILRGNEMVSGDTGITGRIKKNEEDIVSLKNFINGELDYIVEDYPVLKKRVKDNEDYKKKHQLINSIMIWLIGAASGAIIAKIISNILK